MNGTIESDDLVDATQELVDSLREFRGQLAVVREKADLLLEIADKNEDKEDDAPNTP